MSALADLKKALDARADEAREASRATARAEKAYREARDAHEASVHEIDDLVTKLSELRAKKIEVYASCAPVEEVRAADRAIAQAKARLGELVTARDSARKKRRESDNAQSEAFQKEISCREKLENAYKAVWAEEVLVRKDAIEKIDAAIRHELAVNPNYAETHAWMEGQRARKRALEVEIEERAGKMQKGE